VNLANNAPEEIDDLRIETGLDEVPEKDFDESTKK
jgi:hypothetical protein